MDLYSCALAWRVGESELEGFAIGQALAPICRQVSEPMIVSNPDWRSSVAPRALGGLFPATGARLQQVRYNERDNMVKYGLISMSNERAAGGKAAVDTS